MRNVITLITALLLFALPATSFALLDVEMAIGTWQQDPSGTMSYQLPLLPATAIDLEQDAHYDSETSLNARIKVDLPLFLPNIYVMATPMEYEGTGDTTIQFGNLNFTGQFYSKTKLDHYDVALFWGIPLLKTATLNKFDIEWGLNARFIEYESTVKDLTLSNTETSSESLVVPMIYLGAEFSPVKAFTIQVEIRAVEYSDSSYYDYIARFKYKPFPGPLFISAGYRVEDIDIDEDGTRVDVEFSGPFAEVGMKF